MGEKKQHYKLYKSGKQWKTLAITAVVAIAGVLSFNDVTANADVTSATITGECQECCVKRETSSA
ncbi:KxYKxGKxW signal peptide domain-containing protein [Limosilactobacillus fermentum]